MTKVLIASGGTGGHLFPAQQMAEELQEEFLFAGHKLHDSPFFDRKYPYVEIASSNRNPFLLLKGLLQSLVLIVTFKPDVVVGFGSFHGFPVLLAALFLGKKIVLFEPNYSYGKVNRFFAPFAKKIAVQFFRKQGKKFAYIGKTRKQINQPLARAHYGLKPDLFTILVFGGSQGAKFINETFFESAKILDFPFQVIHFTGKLGIPKYDVPSAVKEFEKEMHYAYSAADLAICRSGAGAVAELLNYELPSILIPYPYAYDHQKENAKALGAGCQVLLQKEVDAQKLAAEIKVFRQNLKARIEALREIQKPQTQQLSLIVKGVL